MKRNTIAAIIAVSATGCAAPGPVDPIVLQPIECTTKVQCDVLWQRAQAWVATNSRYRIQTANDVIIQTYGPAGSTTDLAFQVVREPAPSGMTRINVGASCANIFGCFPAPVEAIRSFKQYVMGAGY